MKTLKITGNEQPCKTLCELLDILQKIHPAFEELTEYERGVMFNTLLFIVEGRKNMLDAVTISKTMFDSWMKLYYFDRIEI